MPVSLDAAYQAAQGLSELNRLTLLDQLWTGTLASERPLAGDEIQPLIRLCRDLEAGITRIIEYGQLALSLVEENPEEVQQVYQDLLADERVDERLRAYLAQKIDAAGGIQAYVQSALQVLEERAQTEQTALQEKRALLENGEYTPGDYSKEFSCNVYAGGIGLGIGLAATGGGAVAGGLVVGVSLLFAWAEGC